MLAKGCHSAKPGKCRRNLSSEGLPVVLNTNAVVIGKFAYITYITNQELGLLEFRRQHYFGGSEAWTFEERPDQMLS